jgi:hypothetical protein
MANTRVPVKVINYFNLPLDAARRDLPKVGEFFLPGSGWVTVRQPKPISQRQINAFRAIGATYLGLHRDPFDPTVDFNITELN